MGMWFRHFTFDMTYQTNGIYSNTIVFPSLWERDPDNIQNQSRTKAAVLQSLFGNVSHQINWDSNDLRLAPRGELMIYVDGVDAVNPVTPTDLYDKMDSKRVLNYSSCYPNVLGVTAGSQTLSDESFAQIVKPYKLGKAKVALSDVHIQMVYKTNVPTPSENSDVNFSTVRASVSGYIKTP